VVANFVQANFGLFRPISANFGGTPGSHSRLKNANEGDRGKTMRTEVMAMRALAEQGDISNGTVGETSLGLTPWMCR